MRVFGRSIKPLGGGTRKLEFVLPVVGDRDVLDLGVVAHDISTYQQDNWLHRHVAERARSCLGIDVLADGVRELANRGYDVRVADAQRFDIDRDFDVIVAGDVLEHFDDFVGFFESVRTHLRPSGQLVITTPNPWFFVRIAKALFRGKAYVNAEHTVWFCADTLREMLDRHGFAVESFTYGSSENWLYRVFFLPHVLRHTSIFAIAVPSAQADGRRDDDRNQ